jgi:hypothetical protein
MSGSESTFLMDGLLLDSSTFPFSSLPRFLLICCGLPIGSCSPPEGREDTGEGRILDGSVSGDMAGGDIVFFGGGDDDKEGFEAWRPGDSIGSPGPRSTRYDKGGGGANGELSSCFSDMRFEPFFVPVTIRHILEKPLFFFLGFSWASDLVSSGWISACGHPWPRWAERD